MLNKIKYADMTEVNLLLKWRFLGPQGIEPTTFNIDKINNNASSGKQVLVDKPLDLAIHLGQ